ncbi:MAG: DUF559 domain-containing protein [Actinomycetota bacterium]|nr:DUF559 domain-containing protein [Actinomycetota bacterium]
MGGLLAERTPRRGSPESKFERDLSRLISRAGLPAPVRQYRVRHEGRVVARIDIAYPEQRIAIEADSYECHGDLGSFEEDRERNSILAALGWRILQFTWRQLQDRPEYVIATIGKALGLVPAGIL